MQTGCSLSLAPFLPFLMRYCLTSLSLLFLQLEFLFSCDWDAFTVLPASQKQNVTALSQTPKDAYRKQLKARPLRLLKAHLFVAGLSICILSEG